MWRRLRRPESAAERRLKKQGMPITVSPPDQLSLPDDPYVLGKLIFATFGSNDGPVLIFAREGLTSDERRALAEWAEARIARLRTHGPTSDEWEQFRDAPGAAYRLTVRVK
jgi:hypothetical protein